MTAIHLTSDMLADLAKVGAALDALDGEMTEIEVDHVVMVDKQGERVGSFTNEIGPGCWLFEPVDV